MLPSYEDQPANFEDLCKRAEAAVAGFSRGYATDAVTFARWILSDGRLMMTNLTSVQTRCTELLEENRLLRQQQELRQKP
jgi:hypothetical protein